VCSPSRLEHLLRLFFGSFFFIFAMLTNAENDDELLVLLMMIFYLSNLKHVITMNLMYQCFYSSIIVPSIHWCMNSRKRNADICPSDSLPRKLRRKNRKRFRMLFEELMRNDETFFKDHFRISKPCFDSICQRIQSLGFYPDSARYSTKRHMVTVHHALGMLLIHIGHGCNFGLTGMLCGFSKQTTRIHVKKMKDIFIHEIVPLSIRWPSHDELELIKEDFFIRGCIPNVVGAVDGTHIPILIPSNDHIDYINRKSQHSLVFQGVAVGTTLKFTDFYGGWAGSIHDAHLFQQSSIFWDFMDGKHEGQVLLGDAAYPLKTWCMTPFERKIPQDVIEANYNYWHSSARMVVERAFGVLKKRFPILKQPWSSKPSQVVEVVGICVSLHNICCESDSEWDAEHYKMWLEAVPDGDALHIDENGQVDMLPQRNASRLAKDARLAIARNVPTQPANARRGVAADIIQI
jgi:hypothetical protein